MKIIKMKSNVTHFICLICLSCTVIRHAERHLVTRKGAVEIKFISVCNSG